MGTKAPKSDTGLLSPTEVMTMLEQFAKDGALPPNTKPEKLFYSIFLAWQEAGAAKYQRSNPRGRPSKRGCIREIMLSLEGFRSIPDLVSKMSGRRAFRVGEIATLLEMFAHSWHGNDQVPENVLPALVEHANSLACALCGDKAGLFLSEQFAAKVSMTPRLKGLSMIVRGPSVKEFWEILSCVLTGGVLARQQTKHLTLGLRHERIPALVTSTFTVASVVAHADEQCLELGLSQDRKESMAFYNPQHGRGLWLPNWKVPKHYEVWASQKGSLTPTLAELYEELCVDE